MISEADLIGEEPIPELGVITMGVEDRVGDCRRARHRRRFTHTQHRLTGARHQQHLDHRHFAEAEDGVAAPLAAGHGPGGGVDAHTLLQRTAGGLQHVAMHLLLHALGVDHQAGVLPYNNPADMHLTGGGVDLHIGHPDRPGRTKTRELAVHVAGIGHALPHQPVPLRGLLLRLGVWQPTGLGGSGA